MRKLLTRMGFAVSSRDLYKKNMLIGRQSHEGVSMFPFFDKKGHIQAVMLILSQYSEIFILNQSQLNTISIAPSILPLKNQINMDLSTLKRFANFKKEIFRGLYHFDPWWVLDEVRFKKHWAKEAIKQTNCVLKSNWTSNSTVPRVQDLTRVAYTLDFSRLSHFQGKALVRTTNNRVLNADIHGLSRELLHLLRWDTLAQKDESVIKQNAAFVALSKTPLKTSKIKSKVAPRKNSGGDQWILDPIWNQD